MSQQVEVKVTTKTAEGQEYFEATVAVPGLKTAKITKQDGTTRFATAASAKAAVVRLAERNNWTTTCADKAPVKQAAKQSARTTKSPKAAPAPADTGCCGGTC